MSESVEITLPSSGNLIDESTHEQKLWLSNRTLSEPSGRFDPMPNKLSVLQAECRKGIPEESRAAVWRYLCCLKDDEVDNGVSMEAAYTAARKEVFGKKLGETGRLNAPNFGGIADLRDHCLSPSGQVAFQRLCLVLQQLYALAYCPFLLDLIPTFLLYLSEAEVYYLVTRILKRQRKKGVTDVDQPARKIQTNYAVDIALVRTFKSVLEWRYSAIADTMKAHDAYEDRYFMMLITRIFSGFLPLPVVLRILDAYLCEGPKVYFRVLMAMFKLCKQELLTNKASGEKWWHNFKKYMNSPKIDFDRLMQVAFRKRYGWYFKKSKMLSIYFESKKDIDLQDKAANFGLMHPLQLDNPDSIRLLDPFRDYYFRSWIPSTIQTRKFRMIYSAEIDGRSLETLYNKCATSKRDAMMLLLVEVLNTGCVIGALCSHPLAKQKMFFGDARTFVFRLHPLPQRFKNANIVEDESEVLSPNGSNASNRHSFMTPTPSPRLPRSSRVSRNSIRSSRESRTSNITEEDSGPNYILCLSEFLSIGVNYGTSATALRLNADLITGSSESSDVFDNPPLVSDEITEFDIGGIEIFDFVH